MTTLYKCRRVYVYFATRQTYKVQTQTWQTSEQVFLQLNTKIIKHKRSTSQQKT